MSERWRVCPGGCGQVRALCKCEPTPSVCPTCDGETRPANKPLGAGDRYCGRCTPAPPPDYKIRQRLAFLTGLNHARHHDDVMVSDCQDPECVGSYALFGGAAPPSVTPDDELWLEFVNKDHCGLCGNHGTVNTCGNTRTPAGLEVGVKRPCICPNGRSVRAALEKP